MEGLRNHMEQALRAHEGLSRGVLAAVSGGADSVALLCLLCDLRDQVPFVLRAAHLEHGIRGAASKKDAEFVQTLCERLQVPLTTQSVNVPELAQARGMGLEEAARHARYAFFEQTRRRYGLACVAVGHHREDQAETLLLHLIRGAGLTGLGAMREWQGTLWRPLLGTGREALREELRRRGQSWREDTSNQSLHHARNGIRRELLPQLARLNPAVVQALGRTAWSLAQDEALIQELLRERQLPAPLSMPYGACFPLKGLKQTPGPLLRRYLMEAWRPLSQVTLDQSHVIQMEALCRAGRGGLSLPRGIQAWVGFSHFHLCLPGRGFQPPEEVVLRPLGDTPLWQGFILSARPARPGETGDGRRSQVMPEAALAGAVVRTRRTGDRFLPLGGGGSQPLKQTLIDRKIDRMFRDLVPLVAREGEILWITGRVPGMGAALEPGEERPVCLTLHGPAPWIEN